MLTPDFAYCHFVRVEPYEGRKINRETYGPPVDYRARVNLGHKRVHLRSGQAAQEVVAAGTVFLPGCATVHAQDRLTFNGSAYTVIEARPCYWLDGTVNHVEVTIQ